MRRSLQILGIGWGLMLIGMPVLAEVVVLPPGINIAAIRGETIRKTIQLTSDAPLTSLQVITTDLERSDNRGRIVASDIQVNLPQTTLQENDVLTLEMEIMRNAWWPSGEFQGELWLIHDGGRQVIPVTIQIKDRVWFPALILVGGVALGLGLSWYRTNGLMRDDLVVQVGNLRTQMRAEVEFVDAGLGREFSQRIEAYLIDVEAALNDRDWEQANAQVDQARAVWQRWRKGREDWIAQLNYQKTLVAEVNKIGNGRLGQDLQIYLERLKRQGVDEPTPDALREKLLNARNDIEQVLQAKAQVETLETGIRALPEAERTVWRGQRDELRTRLTRLSLDGTKPLEETDGFKAWQNDLTEFETQLELAVQQSVQPHLEGMPPGEVKPAIAERMTREAASKWQPLAASSITRPFDPKKVRRSRHTMRIVGWTTQGVALIFLAWFGLNNLYVQNSTFGATRSMDYFSLLAWGFGAEVTRDSVIKTIRGLGVSVGEEEE